MEITHRWLKRCIDRFGATEPLYGYEQLLFPIVQGSVYADLRKRSAEVVSSFEAEGNAIGGLSVGEPHEVMYEMTSLVCDILPHDRPRYLMGVGTPANILESIALGVDMFDCVMPTRNGRNGMVFTRKGFMNMLNNKWKDDHSPLDEEGTSFVDQQYTKAYVRHLFKSGEVLGGMVASLHNLAFYLWLASEAREQIKAGTFGLWKENMVKNVTTRL
jgi:queuine tRNA-ribosyltransferase